MTQASQQVSSQSFTDLLLVLPSGLSAHLTIAQFCILKNSILGCCLLQYSRMFINFRCLLRSEDISSYDIAFIHNDEFHLYSISSEHCSFFCHFKIDLKQKDF